MRRVRIISDLHLGGTYPVPPAPGKRGFRLCTRADQIVRFVEDLAQEIAAKGPSELVLNGDTVDFLAELDGEQADSWAPFTADPGQAVSKFKAIVERDPGVFAALNRFLDVGGRLTILLGNHDIELSLPPVRAELRKALGVKPGHDFEFIHDGEAYVTGDALIEHGNRYDAWNQVDLDALRRVRSLMSRRQEVPKQYQFVPPPGSQMVTSVINKIKRDYAFVDLLKPEDSAVAPILLALEPSYRKRFGELARFWYWTRSHGLEGPVLPKFGGDIKADVVANKKPFGQDIRATVAPGMGSAQSILAGVDNDATLKVAIGDSLGGAGADFLRQLDDDSRGAHPGMGTDVSASETFNTALGFFNLAFGSSAADKRMRALLTAIRGLQKEGSFDETRETAKEYLDGASELVKGGFRYVVFGHTHQAKRVSLGDGRWYFNSGTWADVLRFPNEILTLPEPDALKQLDRFVQKLKAGDFSEWTLFRPTYVLLDIDDNDKVADAKLCAAPTS
ncbi:metallophosphoesterase [Bradyrhizobium stylosanthis]|uniref:metallophosphoesterase n=1 Tax=Bradyrhizobium stylosanthis TaxID=1803665 RepID=UPI0009EDC28F|nr:metallophosphoesterase [Bradyrhizobium stylosanthis]